MKNNNVYCKDCKFFSHKYIGCTNGVNFMDRLGKGKPISTIFVMLESNFESDCSHYKKRWWKFWVNNPFFCKAKG